MTVYLAITAVLLFLVIFFLSLSKGEPLVNNDLAVLSNHTLKFPITYDSAIEAWFADIFVSGKKYATIIDTGSPYLNIPDSLPCKNCVPTGVTKKVTYGDGTSDTMYFTWAPICHGDAAQCSRAVFGGTKSKAPTSPVLGLMSLAVPAGVKKPTGKSVIDQHNIGYLQFDYPGRKVTLAPQAPNGSPSGAIPLAPSSKLWNMGIDYAGDFYVALLQPTANNKSLKYLIIDTGSTYSHLPNVSGDLTIDFGNEQLQLKSVQKLPSGTFPSNVDGKVGVLGFKDFDTQVLHLNPRGGTVWLD